MIPGPLSPTVTRNRVAWLASGVAEDPTGTTSSCTVMSGRIPASSQASKALSTASLTQVRRALRGLSKPSKWRFLVKNSETEISRCRAPISTAVTVEAEKGSVFLDTDGVDFCVAIQPLTSIDYRYELGTIPAPSAHSHCHLLQVRGHANLFTLGRAALRPTAGW